ncbi:protein NRT1/ PTR FAMILY 2.13-like [Euphorbia lathyris]|uniref:protein NRT1/ PTR FAMILY 2.13-like n=1 Tax=Euphorbia lathyris TaxID=212925 RepID=UPI0033138D40
MELSDDKNLGKTPNRFNCFSKTRSITEQNLSTDVISSMNASKKKKKPGGWRAMPYILGNETFERLASFGLLANFMVYLMKEFKMEQVFAANIINIWSGLANFAPLLGAFISDAYVGRFRTIAFASCASFLGMVIVTLTAWIPNLHPQSESESERATPLQLGVLFTGLGFLTIGTGGIRPCSIPFGVDQFDPTTEDGLKGINSFFNWYYTSFTVVILITSTVVVYIQDTVSWVLGFGIPTGLMLCSIILFYLGRRIYVHVNAQGSIFSSLAQVFVAAYTKRGLKLPDAHLSDVIYYDPPPLKETVVSLPLTNSYRFLNKGAMVQINDLNPDGTCANPWKLCSIQQIEEVKTLFKVGPIWVSGILCITSIIQQGTFLVSQALIMDRHLGHKFKIPAGSMGTFSMITIGLWLPFYDRILVPSLRKITNHEGGITLLQRIGIGNMFSILAMVVSGIVETKRRDAAISNPGAVMSVMWLVPQLMLLGFCEAFAFIGHIELYNKEFPEHMRSIGNSLFFCAWGVANYLSSCITIIVHKLTRTPSHPDWLTNDLNAGKLDYFYFLLAGMGVLNLIYFLFCTRQFRYKSTSAPIEDKANKDVELNLTQTLPI